MCALQNTLLCFLKISSAVQKKKGNKTSPGCSSSCQHRITISPHFTRGDFHITRPELLPRKPGALNVFLQPSPSQQCWPFNPCLVNEMKANILYTLNKDPLRNESPVTWDPTGADRQQNKRTSRHVPSSSPRAHAPPSPRRPALTADLSHLPFNYLSCETEDRLIFLDTRRMTEMACLSTAEHQQVGKEPRRMTVADKSRPCVCSTALWHHESRTLNGGRIGFPRTDRLALTSGSDSVRCVYSELIACVFWACVSQEAGVRLNPCHVAIGERLA